MTLQAFCNPKNEWKSKAHSIVLSAKWVGLNTRRHPDIYHIASTQPTHAHIMTRLTYLCLVTRYWINSIMYAHIICWRCLNFSFGFTLSCVSSSHRALDFRCHIGRSYAVSRSIFNRRARAYKCTYELFIFRFSFFFCFCCCCVLCLIRWFDGSVVRW